ncbi:MAG: molybdopterin dinucleotide binding domain-containing protein [Adlercreutzia equolifaciens]
MWSDNAYLRELDPEPTIKMNPVDAEARGIVDGDYVEVYNDRGHCVARVVFNDGIFARVHGVPLRAGSSTSTGGCWSGASDQ